MGRPELPPLPDDIIDTLNGNLGGLNETIGFRWTEVGYDRVVGIVPITPALHQPFGLVHGGVYCSIVETMASTAAWLQVMHLGQKVVGLENATSFLNATREGNLTGVCTPLSRGRRAQVWQVDIHNDLGKIAASGKVRLLALEPDEAVAGKKVGRGPSDN